MNKKLLAICLLVTLLLTACTPSTPKKNGEQPIVEKDRNIGLRSAMVQGKQLKAVFRNLQGVTDYAVSGEQLEYVQDEILWQTKLDGLHQAKQTTDYVSWHDEVAQTNERLRLASDQLPDYFVKVDGDNIRYEQNNHFAAYRRANAGKYDLVVCNPLGQKHVVLSGAEELALLGWHKDMQLVLAASWPELPINIYVMDLQPEYVELNDLHVDTFSPGSISLSTLKLGSDVRMIWEYDQEQFAYQLDGKVYVHNLTTGSQQGLASIGKSEVIWAARDLFVAVPHENSDIILWYQGQNTDLSGQSHFVPDWIHNNLYYLSLSGEQNSIYVTDLSTLQEKKIASAKPGYIITCFALSPDSQRLLFVEGEKLSYEPTEKVEESIIIIDLPTGSKQEVIGLSKDNWVQHQQVVWVRENLIALGYIGLMAGETSQTLSFYTLSDSRLSLKRATKLNSGLFTPDGEGVFLSDLDHSDGYYVQMPANVWHYDTVQDKLQQLTQKAEWQIQHDSALAYNPTRQLLFVGRFRGYTLPRSYSGKLWHGVLVDKQGREYTLLKLRDDYIQQAIWIGNRLLVQTTDSVLVYEFTGQ